MYVLRQSREVTTEKLSASTAPLLPTQTLLLPTYCSWTKGSTTTRLHSLLLSVGITTRNALQLLCQLACCSPSPGRGTAGRGRGGKLVHLDTIISKNNKKRDLLDHYVGQTYGLRPTRNLPATRSLPALRRVHHACFHNFCPEVKCFYWLVTLPMIERIIPPYHHVERTEIAK